MSNKNYLENFQDGGGIIGSKGLLCVALKIKNKNPLILFIATQSQEVQLKI